MRYEAIKKYSGQWVKIRPALQVYDDSAVLRDTIEDAWLMTAGESSVTLQSRDTQHKREIGLDHIHSYMEDPESQRTRGTSGVLVMNMQLLLFEGQLLTEPVAPPGTPLKVFVPARPRESLLKAATRMRAQQELQQAVRTFAWSPQGVAAASRAFQEFPAAFGEIDAELGAAGQPVKITVKPAPHIVLVSAAGWWVSIVLQGLYANTIEHARLRVTKWDGHPQFPGIMLLNGPPAAVSSEQYGFGLAALEQPRWLTLSEPVRSYTTMDIARKILTELLDNPRPGWH